MMRPILKGSTDQSVVIRIVDSTDGTPENAVVFNTAGIDLWYRRELEAKVSITEATLAALTTAHADGGFLFIGDGYYRLDLPDAAVATGANGVMVGGTVTGMVVIGCYVPLYDINPYDAVRMGMTALPNVAQGNAGQLPTATAAGLVTLAAVTHTGAVIPTVSTLTGHTAQTGDSFARLGAPAGASVSADVAAVKVDTAAILVDTGTTLDGRIPAALVGGRMDSSVGAMAANVVTAAAIADGAIDRATLAADTGLQSIRSNTAQAGAAGTITLDASASATTDFYVGLWVYLTGGTGVGQARVCTAYNGTTKVATIAPNWATNPDATTTFALMTAAQLTGIQGSVTGSVASVTGAVGSVTGAVGSVTGAVGSVAAGGISAASFAAGAIDAAAIAADAIGASELAASAVTEIRSLASGTSDSGTTTTMVDAARTEADADYWDENHIIVFTSGTIAGQARVITGFDPATDTITFAPATTQVVGTQTYEIWPVAAALRPTVHGRTADITATGAVGIDLGNVENQGTTLALSATTIAAVSGAVGSVTGATGSVTGAVGSVGAGGITAASFGAGAIDAAALAADAGTEIGTAVWASATRVLTAGTNLNNLSAAEVLTQVNAAIDTAIAELGVAAPTATPTLRTGLMLQYMALRNKTTSTATQTTISNNAGTTIATAAQSDDATTYEKSEFA